MKIETVEAKVTSNLPQENVSQMSIDQDGMGHIMKVLSNLYQNPKLAVIREYFTNGVDAHKAVGQTRPVEVTLPSWDSPNYVVKDFGIGMSKEDITEIYAKYGKSTKRDSNEQVGAFGLGCKSALTLATQFTVLTVKDGWKTTVLFTKSASGVADVNIVSHVETEDENGTTVSIPLSGSTYEFNSEAHKFFKFAAPGTVLVNGEAPTSAYEGLIKVVHPEDSTMEAYLKVNSYGIPESYLIMGDVPYVIPNSEIQDSLGRLEIKATRDFERIAKYMPVGIGDVDLTPSREGLMFNERTNAVIDKYMEFLLSDLERIAQEEADGVTDLKEFWEVQEKWQHIVPKKLTWNGKVVPTSLDLDNDYRKIKRSVYGSASHTTSYRFTVKTNADAYLVKGFSADKYAKLNAYITPFMTSQGLSSANFIICDDPNLFTNEWVLMNSSFTIIEGQDIIDKGRAQRKKEREEEKALGTKKTVERMKYPVLDITNKKLNWVPYDEIDEDTPYVWKSEISSGTLCELIDNAYYHTNSDREVFKYHLAAVTHLSTATDLKKVILLNTVRNPEALKRRVKKTYNVKDLVVKANDKLETILTEEVTKAIGLQGSWVVSFLNTTGVTKKINKVLDVDLQNAVLPKPELKKEIEDANTLIKAVSGLGFYSVKPKMDTSKSEGIASSIKKKYPLMEYIHSFSIKGQTTDHVITYFNAVHEQELAAKKNETVSETTETVKGSI